MHPKREKDICNAVKIFFSVWKKYTIGYSSEKIFIDDLKRVVLACSRFVIFNSVPSGEMTVIAPCKIICKLQKITGNGKRCRYRGIWYWQGKGGAGNAIEAIKSFYPDCTSEKFLRFIVPSVDLVYITRKIIKEKMILADLNAESDDNKLNGYAGPWSLCHKLKSKFGGSFFPCGNYWIWVGKSSIREIEKFTGEFADMKTH